MSTLNMEKMITAKDVRFITDRNEMTLWRWRKEKDLDKCITLIPINERHVVLYNIDLLTRWASDKKIPLPNLDKFLKKRVVKAKETRKRIRL
jgi:hypothetical protein